MRLVIVSSHYPPDFTSGATLVAQRLAQGAAREGHEVHVYAGWIAGGDPDSSQREPLQHWEQVDEAGVKVRWLAVAPWLWRQIRANFDNPAVAEDFARYLEDVKPDVVHFHVLQAMGGTLLPAAKRAGAATVVTMHDFWWLCTRLFLVGKDLRPCSMVMDGGLCACEVDRAWRDERAAFLRRALESADLVLAPSEPAAAVLRANGIAPGRLEVDENAVGELAVASSRRRSRSSLRIAYLGGPDPLKGWGVLVEAARRAAGTPGWEIWAYGALRGRSLGEAELATLHIICQPAFSPEELPKVLGSVDAVVVPSVMMETFSLVTREALAAGLPVVCTDSIGPEEVVVQGENGLVVPSGDAEALAGAISALASEEGLAARLAEGARRTRRPRSPKEQVSGLLARYERLLAQRRNYPGAPARPARPRLASEVRRVLFVCGIEGAPLRYRARLPAEGLSLLGVSVQVCHYQDPALGRLAPDADVVVAYRVPATFQVLDLLSHCRSLGIPVLFDVDDLIFDPELADEIPALSILPPSEARRWMEGIRRYRTTMEVCDGFIASTDALAEQAAISVGLPTYRFDNGVGLVASRDADAALSEARRPGPPRIGYVSGTDTRGYDWEMVEPAVARALDRHRDAEAWLVGHVEPTALLEPYSSRIRTIGFLSWRELPSLLRNLDVNLAPVVESSRFNQAKSAVKWLEAALVETPTVASRTTPYLQAIEEGRNGLLASNEEEWFSAIDALVEHPDLRRRLGSAARRDALLRWSPYLQGERYLAILEQAVAAGPIEPRKTSWEPVALDEPPIEGSALEPYPGPGPTAWEAAALAGGPQAAPAPGTASPLGRSGGISGLARRGVRRALSEGPVSAAAAAATMLGRKLRLSRQPSP